jgi:hypothetical protein
MEGFEQRNWKVCVPVFAVLCSLVHPCTRALREKIQRRDRRSQQNWLCLLPEYFLGAVSASSARRKFWRWREQSELVRERLAKTFNAAVAVLTAPKNGSGEFSKESGPVEHILEFFHAGPGFRPGQFLHRGD